MQIKKILGLGLLCLGILACSDDKTSSASDYSVPTIETTVKEDGNYLYLYGDLNVDIPADSFLSVFDYGDIVTVVVADKDTFDAPVVSLWNDVSSGEYLVMAEKDSSYTNLSISSGQLAVDFGLAESTDGKSDKLFILRDDIERPIKVKITLKEKGGYTENLKMLEKQHRAKTRESYPDLSDAEYANFRVVSTPGMGKNALYRSSSPIDISLGRNTYADSLAKEAGIAVFINLTDNEKGIGAQGGFEGSYYSTQKIAALGLPAAYTSKAFKEGLAKGLRFMVENEGPYLVHCREGKDRAGLVSAVLEALMGASIEDIKKDYVKTYTNYFNVVDGKQEKLSDDDVAWFEQIIVYNIKYALDGAGVEIDDIDNTDNLTAAMTKYLQAVGLTDKEIKSLKERLK